MASVGDCIEFKGCKGSKGYGIVARMIGGKQKQLRAHRVAYAEAYGEIPDGMVVCHKCDNRACVNVDHLFLGTQLDNMRDRDAKGRGNQPKGNAHSNSKLTEVEIPRIRDMLACGCSNTDIGKWFDVSRATISSIKHGKTWAHVA